MEFIQKLLSGYGNWDAGQWSLAVAVFMATCYVLEKTLHVFSRLWRAAFPKEPAPPPCIRYGASPVTGHVVQGREDELAELREGLLAQGEAAIVNAGAVVQGQGGIGKSTLAAHYVARFGHAYGGIGWATAADPGELAETLKGLAPQLDVRLDGLAPKPAAQAVLAACAQDGRDWLFVYDNVAERADIADLIPSGAHLIVTTRASAGWDGFACVRTDVLGFDTEDAPAVRLLMEAAGREGDAAGARDLAEDLGGLPLALVVAGALIRAEGYAFAAYQAEIDRVIAQVPQNAAYPDSVIGAVKLSHDRLPADAQAVADLLAWWAPEGLTPDLLTGAPEGPDWQIVKQDLSEEMIALVSDPARVRAAFQALVDASLLDRTGRADGEHAMHRMTGAALCALQGNESAAQTTLALQSLSMGRLKLNNLETALRVTRRGVTVYARLQPGSEALSSSLDQLGFVLTRMARAGQRDYLPEAIKVAQRALALRRVLYGRRSDPVAASLNNLGTARDTQGRVRAAARLFAASLTVNRYVLQSGDARLANGAVNIGVTWLSAGRADLAEPRLREALDIRLAAYVAEAEHPELRTTAGWLISCLLVRAAVGEDTAANEAEARRLCEEFGHDWTEMQAKARQYPTTPPA